jgi:hypothetical protein
MRGRAYPWRLRLRAAAAKRVAECTERSLGFGWRRRKGDLYQRDERLVAVGWGLAFFNGWAEKVGPSLAQMRMVVSVELSHKTGNKHDTIMINRFSQHFHGNKHTIFLSRSGHTTNKVNELKFPKPN